MIDRWIQKRGALAAAFAALYFALSATLARIMPSFLHDVLIWNLFLALLPLLFALFAYRSRHAWFTAICSALWLLFFPNAPYLMTDLMHVLNLPLWNAEFSRPTLHLSPWLTLAHLAIGFFLSMVAGMFSLRIMHLKASARLGKGWAWLLVGGISLLSGYAIFIGRYLRINSWDALRKPAALLAYLASVATQRSALLSLLYALYIFCAYVIFLLFSPPEDASLPQKAAKRAEISAAPPAR